MGAGGGWGEWAPTSLTEWMVFCGGVDLRAFTKGLGANFEPSSSFFARSLDPPSDGTQFEVFVLLESRHV